MGPTLLPYSITVRWSGRTLFMFIYWIIVFFFIFRLGCIIPKIYDRVDYFYLCNVFQWIGIHKNIHATNNALANGSEYHAMIYIFKVGFDAGDQTNFYSFPTALTANIINIGRSTNSEVTGRYVFRIDSQVIDVQPIMESGMYLNDSG